MEFSEEPTLIYKPSALLMLQISVFEVCPSLPTGAVTGNVLCFLPSTLVRLSVSSEVSLHDEAKFSIPDGAAEQDGVLEDDGQARPEGLQRQLGDVDVINHNPPCERKSAVIMRKFSAFNAFLNKAFSSQNIFSHFKFQLIKCKR